MNGNLLEWEAVVRGNNRIEIVPFEFKNKPWKALVRQKKRGVFTCIYDGPGAFRFTIATNSCDQAMQAFERALVLRSIPALDNKIKLFDRKLSQYVNDIFCVTKINHDDRTLLGEKDDEIHCLRGQLEQCRKLLNHRVVMYSILKAELDELKAKTSNETTKT